MTIQPSTGSRALPSAGLAMALTGDRPSAASLLVRARERVRGRQTETTRELIVEAARRRATVEVPQREPLRGELESVAAALDQLSPLQRSLVVATQLCELTQAETAALLDRSMTLVRRGVAEALEALGDTSDVRAALEQLTWQSPTSAEVAAAGKDAERRRHRRRRLVGAGVGAAVLALVASVVVPLLGPDPPAYARVPGRWTYGLALDPPGWTVASHQLSESEELVALTQDHTAATCQVLVRKGGSVPDVTPTNPLRRVRVNGRVGGYARTGGGQRLIWPLGPTTTASAICSGTSDDRATALRMARTMRLVTAPVRLPFRLADLPLGMRLGWVGESDGHTSISIVNTTGVDIDTEAASITVFQVSYGSGLDRVPATGWKVARRTGSISICQTVEHLQFCVNRPTGGGNSPTLGLRVLDRIVADIKIVPEPGDREHWLDANEGLPG